MARRRANQAEAPGGDSFLDVVANLVGILIILVMVVGAQAKRAIESATPLPTAAIAAPAPLVIPDAESAVAAANAVEQSVQDLQRQTEREKLEVNLRKQERDRVQLLVTVAEKRLAEHRQQLEGSDRERYDLEQTLAAARKKLADLDAASQAAVRPTLVALEHLPTPMARTVFGKEVQFRLMGGKLAYIPWDEMLERMKADAPQTAQRLRDNVRAENSLPVIDGWGARYILVRSDVALSTRLGPATQSRVELERFYFVQADDELGEPIAKALAPNSMFRARLAGMEPRSTTVTIWVYPDSFEQFRVVKSELFKLGYLTAGRPLPEGYPIGGSPSGSRSSAQ